MSEPGGLRSEIYNNLNLRETEDLAQIWQDNNRYEWTDETIQIVGEILQERLGELPSQDEPTFEQPQPVVMGNGSSLDPHLDDENLPEFYDPWQVLRLEKWIEYAAFGFIILVAAQNSLQFSSYQQTALGYLFNDPRLSLIAAMIAIVWIAINIGIQFIVVYLPLKALAAILKILMEMEFASRGMRRTVEE